MPTQTRPVNTEAAIFARLWDGGMTVPLARQVLKLGFTDPDTARMKELIQRNRTGQLTMDETNELDDYVRVGDLLAILQSKARKRLKMPAVARNGNG